jgi:hypothetical protein
VLTSCGIASSHVRIYNTGYARMLSMYKIVSKKFDFGGLVVIYISVTAEDLPLEFLGVLVP